MCHAATPASLITIHGSEVEKDTFRMKFNTYFSPVNECVGQDRIVWNKNSVLHLASRNEYVFSINDVQHYIWHSCMSLYNYFNANFSVFYSTLQSKG